MKNNFKFRLTWILVFTLIFSTALLFPANGASAAVSTKQIVRSNTNIAADFTLKDLAGNKIALSKFKGKKVYINFWATWCGYCVQEMPDFEKISKENKDTKLVLLAVNAGESQKTVSKFMKKKAYTFKVLLDLKETVSSDSYHVNGYPTSVFINSDGTINNTVVGMMSYEDMKAEIEKLK